MQRNIAYSRKRLTINVGSTIVGWDDGDKDAIEDGELLGAADEEALGVSDGETEGETEDETEGEELGLLVDVGSKLQMNYWRMKTKC